MLKEIQDYAELAANLIVIIGAIPFLLWLRRFSFERKKKQIKDNLVIKENIKEKLREHVDGYDRSKPHDIGIRLVHWKNYPWKLEDDGYKQLLYYDTNLDKRLDHGVEFLTNTGILVDEHIWFFDNALYLGKYGTYVVDKSGRKLAGFEEVKQRVKLVKTLQYKHIINWDFEEKIEYEPVFYVRYPYTKRKLFEDDFFAQNYDDDGIKKGLYLHKWLNRRNRVKSSRSIKYLYLIAMGWIRLKKETHRRHHR